MAASDCGTPPYDCSTTGFPGGYCTKVTGGRARSAAGASRLVVTNDPSASIVDVTVTSGPCV